MTLIEVTFHFFSFLIVLATLATPILLFRLGPIVFKNWNWFNFNLHSIPVIIVLASLFAFWGSYSKDLTLMFMGYDLEGMSDIERLKSVDDSLKVRATSIFQSKQGVGWPVHAMFWSVCCLPYPSIVYLFSKNKAKVHEI